MSKSNENYSSLTDEELMLAYQSDDSFAFDEIYDRTAGRIQGYLKKRIQDQSLVDDIFQGTYFKFHQTRHQYLSPLPVLPWIFTICQSVMVDALRVKGRHLKKLEDIDPSTLALQGEDPPQAAHEPLCLSSITGIKKISEEQKKALELRFGSELSFEDIAKRLNTSPTNVRQMLSRALKKLRLAGKKTRGAK